MKKFYLTAAAILASATCFAQTTLWNGEDKEIGSKGDVWDRCNQEVVTNDQKDGVNTSDKCLKFTITGNDWNNGSMAFGVNNIDFTSKRLSLMIKKATSSNVRVELKFSDGNFHKVVAWYDGNGEWRKLYFDFSTNGVSGNVTELSVYPTTDAVDGSEDVYVDNIVIEDAPKVGDAALSSVADGSLAGNLKLTGAWIKGECQNADGDWQKVEYNDFATLGAKFNANVTSVDMRGTVTKDVDVAPLFNANPNTIVYAAEAYGHNNVVAGGTAESVVLTDEKAFNIPEGFDAKKVIVYRTVRGGINSFVLPFWVSAADIDAEKLATYDSEQDDKAVFNKVDNVDANVPFLTVNANSLGASGLEFSDKGFVATPSEYAGDFKGVYAPQTAEGLYGIDSEGKLHRGSSESSIGSFHAYLALNDDTKALMVAFEDTPTAINGTKADTQADAPVYDICGRRVAKSFKEGTLQRGLYIVGGKKIVVK